MTTSLWTKLPIMAAKLAALEQAPMATLWVDEEGIIGYVNHRLCETMGYARKDLVGATLDRMLPGVDLGQWRQEWWQIIVSERYLPLFPLTWRHAKGITLEYTASASLVEVSGLQFAVFYLWPRHCVSSEPDAFPVNDATFYLRSLGESVCLLDSLGIIRFANTAFCKLAGGSEADLIGLPLLEIVSPAKSHLTGVWEVLQQKRSSTEYEFRNLAGKSLNIRINVVQLSGKQAKNSRYLVSFIDITEQIKIARELEAQNASFDRLAANVPGFIYKFRMTQKGEFSFPYASRGCQDIFGVDPATVRKDATPILQTIHPDDLPLFQESVMTSAMHLTPWNIEARQLTSGGDWKWFHAASRPQLQDNGDIIWEGLVMDVTTRKIVEEELAKAKLAADASASAKAEFLANMSHEIRTPLNAIIGLNRLVLKSDLAPAQRDYLNKVQLSSENLLAIINNILDFSKIESGKLVTEHIEFNLDSVLENIGSMLEPVAAEKHLDLLIDRGIGVPLNMIGDPLRLVQVLTNLCSNAIKFTGQGEIIITVERVSNNDEDGLRFSVKDTGIGLSEQQKDRIFESFTQADSSTTRHHGGTGLGLTISKHLTELMGGEIGVSSVEGVGSEFYFTLPLNVLPDAQPTSSIPEELEGWHVLLIMENETACSIFEKMLHDLRFKVTICSLRTMNLEKILKNQDQLEQVQHELVLLDWKMHESHKQAVTYALETNAFGAKTPIIVNVSTFEAESIRNLSDKFGNITFLNKPGTPSCLMDAILNACGKDALIRTIQADHDSKNLAFYEASVRGIRVLIVEDNEINQIVVRKTLESAEVIVDVANNGSEAVDCLQNAPDRHYDAVLMDLQMPHMDGFEATTILRKNKRFDALPIIAMTAHTLENDKQKCLETGMQDHVSKPIVPEQLFSKLAKWTISRYRNDPDTIAIPSLSIEAETPIDQKSLKDLTTVNVNAALHLLQGDQSLLQQLLLNFANELSAAPKHLRALLNEDEWGGAADKAHQIKGVAGNLQITSVFEMARKLEIALRNHEDNVAEKVLTDFAAAIDAFIEETGQCRIIEHSAGNEITAVDPILIKDGDFDELVTLFDQLILFLETNNWLAEDYLEQVSLCLGEAQMKEMAQIKNYLTALEFETAADQVRKLRQRLHSASVD
ncbi:MAG: response regulator [Methylococcales bacterium]|nr:response regulator [Methylococcales bacterium]